MSGRDAWIEKVREKDAEIDMLRKALGTAGERINTQDAEIERLKGAMVAADERLNAAGLRVDLVFGCDTAEHMAAEIERLKAEVDYLRPHARKSIAKEKENQAWMEAGL